MEEQLNTEFCKECGIKQAACYLLNPDTGEVRFYSNISGLYKHPVTWKKVEQYRFDKPRYPDLITNHYNFTKLINIQWKMFGEIGDVYKKTGNESFEYCYLKTRLTAIKMCKSFGGGEMLEEYKKAIRESEWDYLEIIDD